MGDGNMMGGGSGTAPDLIERVVGFRAFTVREHPAGKIGLFSPFQAGEWTDVNQEAFCLRAKRNAHMDGVSYDEVIAVHGPVPKQDCMCGLYAYYTPTYLRRFPNQFQTLYGIVSMSGRMECHARGMRAERMTLHALAIPDGIKILPRDPSAIEVEMQQRRILRDRAVLLSESLDVPLVPVGSLAALAAEYGSPLPEQFRPAEEPMARKMFTEAKRSRRSRIGRTIRKWT